MSFPAAVPPDGSRRDRPAAGTLAAAVLFLGQRSRARASTQLQAALLALAAGALRQGAPS